jgi:hypothetical protein
MRQARRLVRVQVPSALLSVSNFEQTIGGCCSHPKCLLTFSHGFYAVHFETTSPAGSTAAYIGAVGCYANEFEL